MSLGDKVESHRFWDIVTLWSRERLEHEDFIARVLASAVVKEGLMLHSTDPKWVKVNDGSFELKGTPYVGYTATGSGHLMILRATALEHLLSVVLTAKVPNKSYLKEEFIFRKDFSNWLEKTEEAWPEFWFPKGREHALV